MIGGPWQAPRAGLASKERHECSEARRLAGKEEIKLIYTVTKYISDSNGEIQLDIALSDSFIFYSITDKTQMVHVLPLSWFSMAIQTADEHLLTIISCTVNMFWLFLSKIFNKDNS